MGVVLRRWKEFGKSPIPFTWGQLAAAFAGSGPLAIAAAGFDQLSARHFDLVINATSTGLDNVELPLPDSVFAPGCLAYEMVYGRETPFMRRPAPARAWGLSSPTC